MRLLLTSGACASRTAQEEALFFDSICSCGAIVEDTYTLSIKIFDFLLGCYTIGFMSQSMPIPIRLSFDMIKRLEDVAIKMGLSSRTAVLKMCVQSFLEDFEKNGVAGLPLDWRRIIHELDGRSQRYSHPEKEPALKGTESPVKYGKRKKKGGP